MQTVSIGLWIKFHFHLQVMFFSFPESNWCGGTNAMQLRKVVINLFSHKYQQWWSHCQLITYLYVKKTQTLLQLVLLSIDYNRYWPWRKNNQNHRCIITTIPLYRDQSFTRESWSKCKWKNNYIDTTNIINKKTSSTNINSFNRKNTT